MICKITYIYGLYEVGKEDDIRYVGKSINPKYRLTQHIKRSKTNKLKIEWISDVIGRGNKIEIKILEECGNNWHIREKYWISKYRSQGNITNIRDGGQTGKYYNISYSDCKEWVKNNLTGITTLQKWKDNFPNLPHFIPRYPQRVFPEFISWGEFLGTGRKHNIELAKNYMSYIEAREIIKPLRVKSLKQWFEKFNSGDIPKNIPKKAHRFYKNRGWISWGDFLSNGNVKNGEKKFISYDECRELARLNNITSYSNWKQFISNSIIDAPKAPQLYYKEWLGWGPFLRTME